MARVAQMALVCMAAVVVAVTGQTTTPPTNPGADATTVSIPTVTVTASALTATSTIAQCPLLSICESIKSCRECLTAIGPYSARGNSVAGITSNEENFFHALETNPSCNPSATIPYLMTSTLSELDFLSDIYDQACSERTGYAVSTCQTAIYSCFTEPACRQCFADLLATRPDSSATVLNSTSCRQASPAALEAVAFGPSSVANSVCLTFPTCTFSKQRCAASPECAACWALLRQGDVASAALHCGNGSTAATLLDDLVHWCATDDAVACEYWRQRCSATTVCDQCLRDIAFGQSTTDIVLGSDSPACSAAFVSYAAIVPLERYFFFCPVSTVTGCAGEVFLCVAQHPLCARCLNGTAGSSNKATCDTMVASLTLACAACSSDVHIINTIVFATSIVGGVSVAACLLVVLAIVAYGRDLVSMRDRIIVGLFLSNSVYSAANLVPINQLRTGFADCGQLALSFRTIRFWRAWWFGGKYGLVSWELFILAASLWALLRGTPSLSFRSEARLHLSCAVIAATAFTTFWIRGSAINRAGYNAQAQTEALDDPSTHTAANDDLDDFFPSEQESTRFDEGRAQFDELEQRMLQVWVGALGLAILLWLGLRRAHGRLRSQWRSELDHVINSEVDDEWAETRRSQWRGWRDRLRMQRDAYAEVARPLEPYVLVFVVFGAPAVLMATDWCQGHSGANTQTFGSSASAAPTIQYGTCDVWCELVLSLRSLASVVVYFLSRERRSEVLHFRTLLCSLAARIFRCGHPTCDGHGKDAAMQSATGGYVQLETLVSKHSWQIKADEIELVKRLAEGAYGVVWDGRWKDRRVAIKVLKIGGVDSEGDQLDVGAEEDFERECAALEKIDHSHLLKFYGVGHLASTRAGFIVTELLALGSLRQVLQDRSHDLPWHVRTSIACQLARGMEALHGMQPPMIHRDLKSANALLDIDPHHQHQYVAKIADFGSSRQFRPLQPTIVYSSFTGTARVTAGADEVNLQGAVAGVLSAAEVSVGIMDARGTMSKCVGTLLWVAPEMFRGDRNYGPAVDVYSFGIMLWEIATRATPWDELGTALEYLELCSRLADALQTGRRPNLPEAVSTEHPAFTSVMQRCWSGDPVNRPTFSQVVVLLQDCGPASLHTAQGRTRGDAESGLSQRLLAEPW